MKKFWYMVRIPGGIEQGAIKSTPQEATDWAIEYQRKIEARGNAGGHVGVSYDRGMRTGNPESFWGEPIFKLTRKGQLRAETKPM